MFLILIKKTKQQQTPSHSSVLSGLESGTKEERTRGDGAEARVTEAVSLLGRVPTVA